MIFMCNGREDIDHQEREAFMKYMLDTNICIYAIKQEPEVVLQKILKHHPFRHMHFINYIC